MAARIRDPLARCNRCPLFAGELRKSVGPLIRCSVCGGRVDHAHVRVLDQGDRLDRARVRQTEKDDIRHVQEFLSLREIVALVLIDAQKGEILPHPDALENLKTGRAGLAIYIYFRTHTVFPLKT